MRAAVRHVGTLKVAALLAVGCSLQDFEYLQRDSDGGRAGTAGSSSSAGTPTRGGSDDSGEGGDTSGSSGGGTKPSTGGSTGGGGGAAGGSRSEGGSGGKGNAGTGAVGELVNASFETGNTVGWNVTPEDALSARHAYVQTPTAGSSVPDGGFEFSTWHGTDKFVVELSQTIKGIEDGVYVFKGYYNLGTGFNKVQAFARDCGGSDLEPVSITGSGGTEWLPISLSGIEVSGGKCTVGVLIDSNPNNWLNADLFTFEPDPNGSVGGAGGAGGQAGESGGS